MAQFPHHRDFLDARNLGENVLHLNGPIFQRGQVRAEYLHRQGTLQSGFGLVHRVLGGLRVVEDDSGKLLELRVDGLDQFGFGAIRAGPICVRFQADVKLDVEKAGGIRAVVGPRQFGGDGGDFGKRF